MCKIDLKDAYFAILLSVKSRKYAIPGRFQWKGLLFEFCCLCLGFSPAILVFTKLLKVPIPLLEKAQFKNNNLPQQHATNGIFIRGLLMARNTLIFIHQHLGFLINIRKSYLEPTSTLEFLGLIVDSGEMTLSLPMEKLLKVQIPCQETLEKEKVIVRELSKLTGRLSCTAIEVPPAPLQYRQFQHQQVQNFNQIFHPSPPQIIISSQASLHR